MSELFIHNPYLRGIGVLAIVETILWVKMFWHRKPGVSRIADMLYPNMVSERGQRMKKWSDYRLSGFPFVGALGSGHQGFGNVVWFAVKRPTYDFPSLSYFFAARRWKNCSTRGTMRPQ